MDAQRFNSTIQALSSAVQTAQQALDTMRSISAKSQSAESAPTSVSLLLSSSQRLTLVYHGDDHQPDAFCSMTQLPSVEWLLALTPEQCKQLNILTRYFWTSTNLLLSASSKAHCVTPERFGEVFDCATGQTKLVRLVATSDTRYESADGERYGCVSATCRKETKMEVAPHLQNKEEDLPLPPLLPMRTPIQAAPTVSMLACLSVKCEKHVDYTQVDTPTPVNDYAYRIQLHGPHDRLCALYVLSEFPPRKASLDAVGTARQGAKPFTCFTMLSHERTYEPAFWEQQRRRAYQQRAGANRQHRFWPLALISCETPLPLQLVQRVSPNLTNVFVDVHVTWLTNEIAPPTLLYHVDEDTLDSTAQRDWAQRTDGVYPVRMYGAQQRPIEKQLAYRVRS